MPDNQQPALTLEDLIEAARQLAADVIRDGGETIPTVLVATPAGLVYIDIADAFNDRGAGNEQLCASMPSLLRELKAQHYVFLTEAWISSEAGKSDRAPSECADRIEVVMVSGGDRYVNIVRHWRIDRTTSPATLQSVETIGEAMGRFVGWLGAKPGAPSVQA